MFHQLDATASTCALRRAVESRALATLQLHEHGIDWMARGVLIGADASALHFELRHAETGFPFDRPDAAMHVFLAVTEDGLKPQVGRGENEGRELRNDAVTRWLIRAGETDPRGAFHRVVPVTIDQSWKSGALRVVEFVQRAGGNVAAVNAISVQ